MKFIYNFWTQLIVSGCRWCGVREVEWYRQKHSTSLFTLQYSII